MTRDADAYPCRKSKYFRKDTESMTDIHIPAEPEHLIEMLESAGFEAYAVGGCIRDCILGTEPYDWDICTSAVPEEMQEIFIDLKTVLTGAKHGTLTVIYNGKAFEITTFRTESEYSDFRHPDRVEFVKSLREDLARRDFTVNAMAYSKSAGLIDFYGGIEDLKTGTLRAVGNAFRRFEEDALRILRALRFMSVYDFIADAELDRALRSEYRRIEKVSAERISAELLKFLNGKRAAELLDEYREIFCNIIPELTPMIDLEQHSPYHNRDVWKHTLAAVEDVPPTDYLRLIMLLHDIGKPVVYVRDENGRGRFVGHPEVGAKIAENILRRLKLPSETIKHITTLINYHDVKLYPERAVVRKWLGVLGRKDLELLQLIRHADASGKYEQSVKEIEKDNPVITQIMDYIEADGDCISLKDLAIDGNDVRAAGIDNGRRIGETLAMLLDRVICGQLTNDRAELIDECKSLAEKYREKDSRIFEEYRIAHARKSGTSCIIFSGSPECSLPSGLDIREAFVIACDSGYLHAIGAGVWPQLVVGDFDSYGGEIYGRPEIIKAPPEKDDTDTLMAVKEAIARGYTDITILGAMGGCTDHEYANIQLCSYCAERNVNCRISDAFQELFVIKDGAANVLRRDYSRISVFALDEKVCGVTLKGLKYELDNEVLLREFPRGVSNEFSRDEAYISVDRGMLLIILSK